MRNKFTLLGKKKLGYDIQTSMNVVAGDDEIDVMRKNNVKEELTINHSDIRSLWMSL